MVYNIISGYLSREHQVRSNIQSFQGRSDNTRTKRYLSDRLNSTDRPQTLGEELGAIAYNLLNQRKITTLRRLQKQYDPKQNVVDTSPFSLRRN